MAWDAHERFRNAEQKFGITESFCFSRVGFSGKMDLSETDDACICP